MNNIISLYSKILMIITSSLSSDSCDVLHNPELLNKAKFYSRAYLLAILYVVKKTKRQNVNSEFSINL